LIITKTPLRVSFAGGGTDLAEFYGREEGAVVSTAIDKYVYIALHRFFENRIVLKYSRTEVVETIDEIQHPLIRECLRVSQLSDPVEITSFADIPATGSGLGSSSSFTVGLLKALHAFRGRNISPEACADLACSVEIDRLGEPIGKQDQYAASFGGLNFVRFLANGSVAVEPIVLSREKRAELESNLVLFYTGLTRKATGILTEQKANTRSAEKFALLQQMRLLAGRLRDELVRGNVTAMGEILHEGWMLKRQMASGISSGPIDEFYKRGRQAGAFGGKLLGAGGGGFLLFFCPADRQAEVARALPELRSIPFRFDPQGARIIYAED
jgi:D-glycero-alpha-D-manno-heptose-7-phosphate kinase